MCHVFAGCCSDRALPQTTDVETEADGLLSYDRQLKVIPDIVRSANVALQHAAQAFFATLPP